MLRGMDYKPVKFHRPVRMKLIGELGVVWPQMAQLILSQYMKQCKEFGRAVSHFKVDGLPMSLNHQYKKNKAYLDKNTGKMKSGFRLDPKILDYRMRVCEALGTNRWKFKPTGTVAAVILLESPMWITTKREVRQMDADNRVKPILDSIEHAMDLPDELCWNHHVFKIQSKRERTRVWLFDLGDVVEHYY
jgi:Holliday junction resolvase RusA-like endonuclease